MALDVWKEVMALNRYSDVLGGSGHSSNAEIVDAVWIKRCQLLDKLGIRRLRLDKWHAPNPQDIDIDWAALDCHGARNSVLLNLSQLLPICA
ncbi:hypothetical protein TNCV_1854301 [Trichonephila clavipes]|nr:hypothetical protein TNCV_1854301 [Trichonephila clavipes]